MLESEKREMIECHLKAMLKASDRKIAELIVCEPKEVGVVRHNMKPLTGS